MTIPSVIATPGLRSKRNFKLVLGYVVGRRTGQNAMELMRQIRQCDERQYRLLQLLPNYNFCQIRLVARHAWDRGRDFGSGVDTGGSLGQLILVCRSGPFWADHNSPTNKVFGILFSDDEFPRKSCSVEGIPKKRLIGQKVTCVLHIEQDSLSGHGHVQ